MIVKKTTSLWILSYILVLILPVAINLASYDSVENIMLSQVVRNNRYVLEGKMESIDTFLSGMLELSASCVTSEDLNGFAELSLPIRPDDRYRMTRFMREWSVAKTTVGVDNIYAYLPKTDFVLGGSSMNSPELFFITEYGGPEGYERWKSFVVNGKESGFQLMKTDKEEKLLYVCIPKNSILEENRPVVVLEVNISTLARTLFEDDGGFFVFDDDNNTMIATGNDPKIETTLKAVDYQPGKDFQRVKIDGRDLIVSYEKSASSQWRYLYVLDRGKYMKSIIYARTINYLGIGISILLGLVLIRISVKRNHKPLEMLVEQLQKGSKRVRDDPDDYRYISKLIHSTLMEKNEIQTAADLQKKVLRDSVLLKLSKDSGKQKDMDSLLHSFDIHFPHEMFAVGAIYIDNVSEMFFEKGGDEKEKLMQAQFVIRNVLEELLSQYFVCYSFENDDILCFIVNSQVYDATAENRLEGCIRETQEFSKKNFNFSFISAVSDGVCGRNNIPVAFDQAMEVLEYRFMLDDESLLTPQEVEKKRGDDYYYPLKKEQEIINAVKAGDYEAALSALDDVLNKNFRESHMSGQLAKCLIFDILCTLIKSVKEIDQEAQYLDSLNLYSRITECNSVAAMRDELVEVLKEICRNINQGEKKRNILIDSVIEYVKEHYDDENLSVASIAEACGTSPNYLSFIFKQNVCVGLLDYISGFRIEKAKKALASKPGMSVEEIAHSVGYANVRTFVRVFRKYEVLTPTQYRQNL